MPGLAFNKNTLAFCLRGMLYFLSMPTVRAYYFLLFNRYFPPAIDMNAFFNCSNTLSSSFCDTFLARLLNHSFRILCCSLEKCSKTFLSSSDRIATILPNGVSGPKPDRRSRNSSHFIPFSSLDKRIPYCV